MATEVDPARQADPLRSTLDTLALDPAAKQDRPYLITMLRRLGYSEVEIRQYLGEDPSSAGKLPAITPPQVLDTGERDIEIEYTGPGLREYALVLPPDSTEYDVDNNDPYGLGEGMEAGTEVLGGGPSMEEVDRLMQETELSDFDDWGEGAAQAKEEVAEATLPDYQPELETVESPPGAAEEGLTTGGEPIDLDGPPGEGGADFGAGAPKGDDELVSFGEGGEEFVDFGAPPAESAADGPTPDDFQVGEPLVEFEALELRKGVVGPARTAEEAAKAAASAGLGPESRGETFEAAEPDESGEGQSTPVTGSRPDGAFQHQDWTLYSRDVELSDGRAQRIYFFSKGEPKTGDPAVMPEGYEVATNERTGLPYLRRKEALSDVPDPGTVDQAYPGDVQTSAPGRKRVRIMRVSGTSKEDAEKKIRAAGGDRNVLASMPIDIEQRYEE